MTQIELWSVRPIYRRTDPPSSRIAAEEITRSGSRASQKKTVLDLVRKHPFSTSAELAKYGRVDRYMVARRLPELERDGLVRKGRMRGCTVNGRLAVSWLLTA